MLSTKDMSAGSGGTKPVIGTGNHKVKINSITFDQTPYDADAFNISGLQELQLGAISLGGTNATITEFSVDGTFTANSDNIVPTQKAIKTYIQSQIGGGAGELNVNQLTAGNIRINSDTITNTLGETININTRTNFTGGIKGDPVAMNMFLSN